jgi:HlyD family secretion protein
MADLFRIRIHVEHAPDSLDNAKQLRRPVKLGPSTNQGVRIDEGLVGGEDLIVNPPADLKDGDKVAIK